MCAIVGFNSINKNNILNDMLDMVNHRGPDDRGIYNVRRLWLVLIFQMWYKKYKKYISEPVN